MKLLRIVSSVFNKKKQLEIKAVSARNTYTAEAYGSYGTDARPI
jgi:hypothetical protein